MDELEGDARPPENDLTRFLLSGPVRAWLAVVDGIESRLGDCVEDVPLVARDVERNVSMPDPADVRAEYVETLVDWFAKLEGCSAAECGGCRAAGESATDALAARGLVR